MKVEVSRHTSADKRPLLESSEPPQNAKGTNNSSIQSEAAMQQFLSEDKPISDSSLSDGYQVLQKAQMPESLSEADGTVFDKEPPKPDSTDTDQVASGGTPLGNVQQREEPQKPELTSRARLVLEDYEIQLRLLEAQNKKRLEMARQEQAKLAVPSSQIQTPIMSGPPQPNSPVVMNTIQGNPTMAIRNKMGTMQPSVKPPNQPNQNQMIIMLQAQIKALQDENQNLRRQLLDAKHAQFAIFHCITGEEGDKVYLDQPRWVGSGKEFVLKAYSPVLYPEAYGLYKSLHFVVYKTYSANLRAETENPSQQDIRSELPDPEPDSEFIKLVSEEMMKAMEKLAERDEATQEKLSCFVSEKELQAPHLWWYCYRNRGDMLDGLTPSQAEAMQCLMRWLDEVYSQAHSGADDLFKRGMVSASSISYLIQPGDVLVCKVEDGFEARLATSWPQELAPRASTRKPDELLPLTVDKYAKRIWEVDAWSYRYNGDFHQMRTRLNIQLDADPTDEVEMSIADLIMFPLRFASKGVRDTLRRRGKTFWDCRNGKYVSYSARDKSYTPEQRFMIDCRTYYERHPASGLVQNVRYSEEVLSIVKVKPAFFDKEDAPSKPDVYLFPRTVMGYDLRQKKWEEVDVDLIRGISWDINAFTQLVTEAKELVHAVMATYISLQRDVGVQQSKGKGLTMLLRGDPGTGKTFTVESVAELVERPLYVVRCNDMDAEPEDVAKRLEDSFFLAKTWGCIVLLVEAEVLLERRTSNDVAQNARVSAFFRALEGYRGVLILESNRLATLDEAFNSRIQLVLHYKPLTEAQRTKVWHNLFDNIMSLDKEAIDFHDVFDYVATLAKRNFNGHQMHRVITTARQLAHFHMQKMNPLHLDEVVYSFEFP